MKKILIIEPFFTGSHANWAKELKEYSSHEIEILALPGRHWKWRMYGGAISLAKKFNELDYTPHLILTTDMLDLPLFISLTKNKIKDTLIYIYFHENQLTYPWSPTDKDKNKERDYHYIFKNYTSALAADKVFFNSNYHKNSFINSLPDFLKKFPDYNELETVEIIKNKSKVLYLGLDLKKFDKYKTDKKNDIPLILWNHRWEYDKNPESFFNSLFKLKNNGLKFNLAVIGENYKSKPAIFETAKIKLENEIIKFGYAESFKEYASLLWQADILPVTNIQDFFGISIMEALYCETTPLLPDRLTYPELFEINKNNDFFYKDDEELYNKLKVLILNYKNKTEIFKKISEKFCWEKMIRIYDEILDKNP